MTNPPDYSELIERAPVDLPSVLREAAAELADWYFDETGRELSLNCALPAYLNDAADALSHLAAENVRLRLEADTMIAAGLGARIDASMDGRAPLGEGWQGIEGATVFISATCEGEHCRCGRPAVRKVGEEIPSDDPGGRRHNFTAYVCAPCFADLLGPWAASSVGLEPLPPPPAKLEGGK